MNQIFLDVPEEHEGSTLTWTITRRVHTVYPGVAYPTYSGYTFEETSYYMELQADEDEKWSHKLDGLTDKHIQAGVKNLLEQKSVSFRKRLLKEGPVQLCNPTPSS